jgi:hypothetical protein
LVYAYNFIFNAGSGYRLGLRLHGLAVTSVGPSVYIKAGYFATSNPDMIERITEESKEETILFQ